MTNQGFDPLKTVQNIRDGVNRFIEEGLSSASGAQVIAVDMYETAQSVVVKAGPLIGVQPEDIDVSVTGGSLTIKGEMRPEDDVQGATYLRRERKYGPFARTIPIPIPINPEGATADFKNWLLIVTIPKAEQVKTRTINIETDAPPTASIT